MYTVSKYHYNAVSEVYELSYTFEVAIPDAEIEITRLTPPGYTMVFKFYQYRVHNSKGNLVFEFYSAKNNLFE